MAYGKGPFHCETYRLNSLLVVFILFLFTVQPPTESQHQVDDLHVISSGADYIGLSWSPPPGGVRVKLYQVTAHVTWASCQIRKIAGYACAGNAGSVSPPPRVSDPDMQSRHVRGARAVMHVRIAN